MTTPTNPPGGTPANGDPSMEDILASIRRILSEEQTAPPADQPAQEDVLVLDPSMMVYEPRPGTPDVNAAASPAPSGEAPAGPAVAPLVAPAAAAAAASSVGSLVRTLTSRSTQVHSGGPTLEDIVRDEMKPLLKQWLDANLPPLVERLVRAEIERVVGRTDP